MDWAPKDEILEQQDKPKFSRKKTLDPEEELEALIKREEEKRQRKEKEDRLA